MSEKINILALLFNGHAGNAEQIKDRIESLTGGYNQMVQIISPDISLADRVRAHAVAIDMPHAHVYGAELARAKESYQPDGRDLFVLRQLALRVGLIDGLNPAHDLQYCM